jgi:hypothetical protein
VPTPRVAGRSRRTPEPRIQPTSSAPSWIARVFGPLATNSLASTFISASSIAALLGGMAFEWRVGYQQGIAAELGISTDFVHVTSDPAATPFQITLLVLLGSAVLTAIMMVVPAFTIWQVPAILGLVSLLGVGWDFLSHPPSTVWRYDLIFAGSLFALSAAVAGISYIVRRLMQRLRDRRRGQAPPEPPWLVRWLARQPGIQWSAKIDGLTTSLMIIFLISLVIFSSFWGAEKVGSWFGERSAAPDQAVVDGNQTYGWLGTTSDGLMVVRVVDFCGSPSPETAHYVRINGVRSLLLKPDGQQVIRLRTSLRLVRTCP